MARPWHIVLLLLALLSSRPAAGHPLLPNDATLVLSPDSVDLSLSLGWHALSQDVADPEAADRFLEAQLRAEGPARAAWVTRVKGYLAAHIELRCDGAVVPLALRLPALEAAPLPDLPATSLPTLGVEAEARMATPPGACTLALDENLGATVLRVRRPGAFADDRRLLSPGEASPPFPLRPQSATSSAATDASSAPQIEPAAAEPSLLTYIRVGFEHIVPEGLDHVLFVLALFLLGAGARLLLYQVTAFTVAHSLTLAAGLLGWATLPPSVIEPAIAASIAFVALEDLLGAEAATARRRVVIVFLFGLLHGLGFAGALSEAGLPTDRLAKTILGFNVGVELGQLAVLLAAFVATAPLRRWARYDSLVRRPLCVAIALTGVYWTISRLSGA